MKNGDKYKIIDGGVRHNGKLYEQGSVFTAGSGIKHKELKRLEELGKVSLVRDVYEPVSKKSKDDDVIDLEELDAEGLIHLAEEEGIELPENASEELMREIIEKAANS